MSKRPRDTDSASDGSKKKREFCAPVFPRAPAIASVRCDASATNMRERLYTAARGGLARDVLNGIIRFLRISASFQCNPRRIRLDSARNGMCVHDGLAYSFLYSRESKSVVVFTDNASSSDRSVAPSELFTTATVEDYSAQWNPSVHVDSDGRSISIALTHIQRGSKARIHLLQAVLGRCSGIQDIEQHTYVPLDSRGSKSSSSGAPTAIVSANHRWLAVLAFHPKSGEMRVNVARVDQLVRTDDYFLTSSMTGDDPSERRMRKGAPDTWSADISAILDEPDSFAVTNDGRTVYLYNRAGVHQLVRGGGSDVDHKIFKAVDNRSETSISRAIRRVVVCESIECLALLHSDGGKPTNLILWVVPFGSEETAAWFDLSDSSAVRAIQCGIYAQLSWDDVQRRLYVINSAMGTIVATMATGPVAPSTKDTRVAIDTD